MEGVCASLCHAAPAAASHARQHVSHPAARTRILCGLCRAKIVEGRVAKTLKTVALLEQPFIKDGDKSVATIIKEAVSVLGENIQVRRFERCARCRDPPCPGFLAPSTQPLQRGM